MSTKNQNNPQNNLSLVQVKERIDEYQGTIHAIQAFISMTTWDPQTRQKRTDSKFSLGRRMATSSKNLVSPVSEVTPDVVIQVGNELGYTIEVKYSMPKDKQHWVDDANQLLKYDDSLKGWWTKSESIISHCNALLIEQGRVIRFVEFLEEWINENQITFNSATSIIQFSKSDNAYPYYFLQSRWGKILDDALSERLKYGEKIPIEKVVGTYGHKKFYDTEPPAIEFTMSIIWQDIFTPDGIAAQHDKKLGGIPLYVNLDGLTLELQKLFGQNSETPRDVEFPRKDWIRAAMDEFVNIGLASRLENNPDGYDYLVIFRQIKKELLEYFVESRKKIFNKGPKAKQLNLFGGKSEPSTQAGE